MKTLHQICRGAKFSDFSQQEEDLRPRDSHHCLLKSKEKKTDSYARVCCFFSSVANLALYRDSCVPLHPYKRRIVINAHLLSLCCVSCCPFKLPLVLKCNTSSFILSSLYIAMSMGGRCWDLYAPCIWSFICIFDVKLYWNLSMCKSLQKKDWQVFFVWINIFLKWFYIQFTT